MSSTFKLSIPRRSERVNEDDEWTKLDHPTQSPPRSPSIMPLSLKRTRRPSTSHPPSFDAEQLGIGCRHGHNVDVLDSDSSPSVTAHDSSSHSVPHFQHYSTSLPSRHRTSFLSAASDALGFRKKITPVPRRKPTTHSLPHTMNIMPGVIEINANNSTNATSTPHRDCEHEERERLRDVAAQSIGLDPELLHPSKSETRSFLDSPQSPTQPAPIPPFPATLHTLRPFTELSATLPKFTPPSSLLVYALVRQWKFRTIVLTSHSPTHKTHVHLFKGTSKDEKEIERLEVTEDSLIYVAEEELGGRRNVIKFVAKNVSSNQSGPIAEESLCSMWFFHIRDPAESHRWIAAIKNTVLTQRAMRAGLEIPAQLDGRNEPKGDMDVMLSMHLQRNAPTHPLKSLPAIPSSSQLIPASPSPPPSLHSLRINTSSSPSPTTIKGIFSGTRPRSPSVDGSLTLSHPPGQAEDSFSAAGTSLLTMLRNKSSTDSSSPHSRSLPLPLAPVPRQGSPAPSVRSANVPVIIPASDLKISKERDAPEVSTAGPEASSSSTPPGSTTPPTPTLSPSSRGTLTVSLQPPPRKGKPTVASNPTPLPESQGMYSQPRSNSSVAGNFGIPSGDSGDFTPRATSPVFSDSTNSSGGQAVYFAPNSCSAAPSPSVEPHEREKTEEVTRNLLENEGLSRSSPGSGSVPTDKLLQSTAITKRWSRQGVPLPKQLTPPSGPPPSIPPSSDNNNRRISMESGVSIPVTYTADRSPSSSSSNFHSRAQWSARSGSSLSPTFWKRTSSSSTYSASSISTSDSRGRSQIRVPFGGESFSSSMGSVAGNEGSLRPMSLSVHGSSPVVHIGVAKRRSMPPPRPAPNFAPPPAPTIQESTSGLSPLTAPTPAPQKPFRSSVAQRALRLSLTSPKPPPSSALPPRPDEDVQGHHHSSSTGTSDSHPIPAPSSRPTSPFFRNSTPVQRTSSPSKSLSIRQRLRILSTPPVQSSPSLIPPNQVSTLDLSDDTSDDPPTPYCPPTQPIGLGEHIVTTQQDDDDDDPSFLQLGTPITPTIPKPPPRSPFRPTSPSLGAMGDWRTPLVEPGCDFVALSPPPPRRSSKPHVAVVTRPEKLEAERTESVEREESQLVSLSQRGSVVSLGFVTT